ncbi:MAG: hypothetical protein A2283_05970 [Lentisphaerae bacterium RIFOXYA12_FULL_48_11]|nr:MAG: hypothetical protein A2283_05970 [Lentisphaerae bacterium RIFOXYA12_FULL_48_11]
MDKRVTESGLREEVAKLGDKYVSVLQELVCCPSAMHDVTNCIRLVKNKMVTLGLDVTQPVLRDDKTGISFPAVVGSLRGAGVGPKTFVVNAHVDTAPVEDVSSWSSNPYKAVIANGKMYGRGVLDDKAGIAMMLLLADAFSHFHKRLPATLLFECVSGDESGGHGSKACLDAGKLCDAALVIDGADPLSIIDAHLGQVWLNLYFAGKAAASCSARRVHSPLLAAVSLLKGIEGQVEEWCCSNPSWEGIQKPYFVNAGRIHSGTWAGATPERCEMSVQIGFAPPVTVESVCLKVNDMADKIAAETGLKFGCNVDLLCHDAFASRDNNLVEMLKTVIRDLRGGESPVVSHAVTGHCDLRYFRRNDGTPADACLYGPGGGGNPHACDEFYEISHFVPVAQNIATTILRWSS